MSSIGNSLIGDSTYFSYLPNEKFLNQSYRKLYSKFVKILIDKHFTQVI